MVSPWTPHTIIPRPYDSKRRHYPSLSDLSKERHKETFVINHRGYLQTSRLIPSLVWSSQHVTSIFSPQILVSARAGYLVTRRRSSSSAATATMRIMHTTCLETVDLDSLAIKTEALLLVRHEILHIFALVSLQLDHLSHLRVCDNGAIAGELLLDHFEDLLLVEFLG
jgi:hypothetical protein